MCRSNIESRLSPGDSHQLQESEGHGTHASATPPWGQVYNGRAEYFERFSLPTWFFCPLYMCVWFGGLPINDDEKLHPTQAKLIMRLAYFYHCSSA